MHPIPFYQRLIRGAIGKAYVIKHYKGGRVVKTKYPHMHGIVPSPKQKVSRRTFRKAVQFAQSLYWNREKKEVWNRKLRKPRRLFQALMKVYYKQKAEKAYRSQVRLNRWRRNIAINGPLPTVNCQLPSNNIQLTTINHPRVTSLNFNSPAYPMLR